MKLRTRIAGTVVAVGLAAILAASCGGSQGFVLNGEVVSERYISGVHYFILNTHQKGGMIEIGMSQTAMPDLVSSLDRYGKKELENNILARAKNLVDNGEYASIPDAVDSIINPGVSIEVRFDAAPSSGSLYYNADNMFLSKGSK